MKQDPYQPTPATGTDNQPRKADKYIWAIYLALLAISVVELYSASSREVQASNVFGPLVRHGMMLLFGFGITLGLSRMKFKWLIPMTNLIVIVALFIGFYVMFKGQIINGARRSMSLLGISLQSSELLKLACVLFIAKTIAFNQERGGVTTKGVIYCAAFVLLCSFILFSQGLTNTLLLMGVSVSMMLVGGIQWKKLGYVIVAYGIIGSAGMIYKANMAHEESPGETAVIVATGQNSKGEAQTTNRFTTQLNRVERWLGVGDSIPKYAQPITAENRQEMYSYMAQANGSWHGVLPGNSRETARLPLAFSDYIYAIIVEDWGFLGGFILLCLYLCLLGRAGAIAARCRSAFPTLLIMGMAVMIVLQALFHMAIVTGVFPVSGQPLPLISKGGSSILVTSIAFGIMLSVSRSAANVNDRPKVIKAEIADLPSGMTAENPLL
ncbi:MAG: FtsW/RodA/SpoVE family cell cycle protein [Muribaculaceae bacterium]|nr:FtsW/RodA/SpoVE family cell cycle protein [Muribaculaceae bacterium]